MVALGTAHPAKFPDAVAAGHRRFGAAARPSRRPVLNATEHFDVVANDASDGRALHPSPRPRRDRESASDMAVELTQLPSGLRVVTDAMTGPRDGLARRVRRGGFAA